jgi:inhibitor of cysteine peptidase
VPMDEPTLRLDQQADGREFRVHLGSQLEIALPENPTTGYRWHLGGNDPAFALMQDRFDAPAGPPGKGGIRRCTFRAVRAGKAEIRAVYRRSWESEGEQPRGFRIVVTVLPK